MFHLWLLLLLSLSYCASVGLTFEEYKNEVIRPIEELELRLWDEEATKIKNSINIFLINKDANEKQEVAVFQLNITTLLKVYLTALLDKTYNIYLLDKTEAQQEFLNLLTMLLKRHGDFRAIRYKIQGNPNISIDTILDELDNSLTILINDIDISFYERLGYLNPSLPMFCSKDSVEDLKRCIVEYFIFGNAKMLELTVKIFLEFF